MYYLWIKNASNVLPTKQRVYKIVYNLFTFLNKIFNKKEKAHSISKDNFVMNMQPNTMESDESNSSTSNDSSSRHTRLSSSRLAKKSTGQTEMTSQPLTRSQAAVMNKEKQKFLGNFNPETSARERKKLEKKLQVSKKLTGCVNDDRGVHIASGIDLCDCLEVQCPGCFYSCKKCGSNKCGVECRTYRKVKYESIEYHGYNFVKKNPVEK